MTKASTLTLFKDGETEAQRGLSNFPGSHSSLVTEPDPEAWLPSSGIPALNYDTPLPAAACGGPCSDIPAAQLLLGTSHSRTR